MRIAVVGAGIAGLACARRLLDSGHRVAVFERGGQPGGRVATTLTEVGGFDHGAQYLTARDPSFVAQVASWSHDGVVEPWSVEACSLPADAGRSPARASRAQPQRWVGSPGMSAIGMKMAAGLDVRYDARVVRLDAVGGTRGSKPRWSLHRRDVGSNLDSDLVAVTEGIFDAVVIAVPAPSAIDLLGAEVGLARQAAEAHFEPCWALMIGLAEPVAAGVDAAFVDGGRLAWIARESSKPARRPGERWTVHAQSAWSVEHFDDDPEDVKAELLHAFHAATGKRAQPIYTAVHRWRYALARKSLSCDFLWDGERRIGACGDWCRGHRFEDAWLSGVAMAGAVSE